MVQALKKNAQLRDKAVTTLNNLSMIMKSLLGEDSLLNPILPPRTKVSCSTRAGASETVGYF